MRAQQACCGNPLRPQHPTDRRRDYFSSVRRISVVSELRRWQGHQAPSAVTDSPLMHSLSAAVKHEVAGVQLDPVIYQWCFAGRKRNETARRRQRYVSDARQIFVTAKDLQMVQVLPRQACIEIPAASDRELEANSAKSARVFVRVAKTGCTTLQHPHGFVGRKPSHLKPLGSICPKFSALRTAGLRVRRVLAMQLRKLQLYFLQIVRRGVRPRGHV